MAYGPHLPDLCRKAAAHVDKILRVRSQVTFLSNNQRTFELTINNRTAKAIGLTIPPSVVLRADQIVE